VGKSGPPFKLMFLRSQDSFPKQNLNPCSRFCRALAHYRQTDKLTDRYTPLQDIGHNSSHLMHSTWPDNINNMRVSHAGQTGIVLQAVVSQSACLSVCLSVSAKIQKKTTDQN